MEVEAVPVTGLVRVGGRDFVADPSGALVLPEESALLVADLHLEKGSAFAERGQMLPPYDSRQTLAALSLVLLRYRPRTVIVLGDSLHDRRALRRIAPDDLASLSAMQVGADWIWLTGNHDPVIPAALGGEMRASATLGGVTLRHEPGPAGAGPEIAGHLHPAGKVRLSGRSVRRRCFVSDGARCVMPAFGAYAGGLNLLDAAFRPLFPAGFTAHMLGEARVYAIAGDRLAR
ncbi:ligase-associated DNA damage response endonuclease PdeM [Alsobacter ponti]|uniref:ligase-associated DNA damage response endonuclease PdeM n=1 Tax=Alsobacter ponti TaxID=2962936 RepID=UPI0035313A61